MLIAMTVLLLAFAATMTLLPNAQDSAVDTEVAIEALNVVEKMLEHQQSLARKDFKLVNATSSTETIGSITYQKDITAVSTDYFTKEVTATVSWGGMYNRAQTMTLKSVVSNFEEAVGGDTCDSILTGNWYLPQATHRTLGAQIMGDTSSTYAITDIDAYRNRLYVAMNNTGTLPTHGPRDATTATNVTSIGSVAWNNVGNGRLSDNTYATAALTTGQTSHYLRVNNFGFAIPQDATIVGIRVDVERKASSNVHTVRDSAIRLVKSDGTLGSANRASTTNWPTADAVALYGGSSDLWNETVWNPQAINSNQFGVAVAAIGAAGTGSRTASIDSIRVTVTYTRQLSILSLNTPTNPTFTSALGSNMVSQGFTSVAIATSTTSGNYAFVTTASTTAQFQTIDIGVTPATVVSTYRIPNATGLVPNTLFYKDGYVYIGFPNNGGGDEFVVLDAHNPLTIPAPLATFSINAGINAIYVKSGYAFIATDDPLREVVVLNLTNLTSPTLRGIYNAPPTGNSSFGLGRSVYTVGDTLYFGRYYINGESELAILDTTSAAPSLLGTRDIGTTFDARSVYATVVRSGFAFLFTGNATGATSRLQIVNAQNPASLSSVASVDLISSGEPRGFDCESNYVYAASVPVSGGNTNKGSISIITAP